MSDSSDQITFSDLFTAFSRLYWMNYGMMLSSICLSIWMSIHLSWTLCIVVIWHQYIL